MATTLLLFQATRQNEVDEARSHMAALERMASNATLYQLGPAGLPHDLDTTILAASWRRADNVVSLFPELNLEVLSSAPLRDIFQLFFVMHALTKDMDRHEKVYGLNYDLKYRIMSIMAAVAEQTPLDLPYLLLVSLHCWIFMFGQNQMHERNDDGIHSMLDGARELLRQKAQMAVWHSSSCAKSIVWILTSIAAYSLYTLRQPAEINDDVYRKLRYSLCESGIQDETQLHDFMAMCSGEDLWPNDAISVVWRQL
ncbi:hypothetical protein PRZ48_014375 [Zasmidium cellare]|uniref:Uncharacterized protein n=1 Tax=Zasmidium cellare TaxID=395010 RepID=A0ABR0DY47_ZASCE|nr:hypothetical protein PRZ48_014375 [Zasmidium cellare]